jgi:osmotically-inducible protein OsmY
VKRGVLLTLLVLVGCGHAANHAPAGLPTLPPGGAFKDGLVYAAVKAKIAGADLDAAARISVRVHAGAVTLSGTVRSPEARERFVALASKTRGVNSVDDELHVGHLGPSLIDVVQNASLIAAVTSALTAQAGVNVGAVKVRAERGVVTLSGTAPTAAVRSTLVAAAKHTPGVRNVVDLIAVK